MKTESTTINTQVSEDVFSPLAPYLTYSHGKSRHYSFPASVMIDFKISQLKKYCNKFDMEYHGGSGYYTVVIQLQ